MRREFITYESELALSERGEGNDSETERVVETSVQLYCQCISVSKYECACVQYVRVWNT